MVGSGKSNNKKPAVKKTGSRKNASVSPRKNAPSYRKKTQKTKRSSVKKSTRRRTTKPKNKDVRSLFSFLRTRRFWSVILSLGFTGVIIALFILLYFAHDLPDIDGLNTIKKQPGITIKTQDGIILNSYGDIYGEYITYDQMPSHLVQAVLATEDRRFFDHSGIDFFGIARAMVVNISAGRFVQGGSTITQQVAKNIFLNPERTIKRKIQEMLLAFWLEGRYSKEDILAIYLNRVYLGAGNYGVDAASQRYFDKSAKEIDLTEAAVLAGLLKAPSKYSPTSNSELTKKRAHQVLLNMVDAGYLLKGQVERALQNYAPPKSYREGNASGSRYFTDWIVDQIPDYIGNSGEDVEVISTLDPQSQRYAEEAVEAILQEHGEEKNVSQSALLSMDPSGAVRAMVGGRSYFKSQYNRATQAKRQPGSTFKMLVYLAGLEAGISPDTRVIDQPLEIQVGHRIWQPKNFDNKFRGEIAVREGIQHSINTVSVQIAMAIGVERIVDLARRMGIPAIDANPSIALGSVETSLLQIVGAYAHLANNGYGVIPYGIDEIRSKDGRILYQRRKSGMWVVVSSDVVAAMNDMLMGVVHGGTGGRANIGRNVAGKTGTSQDFRDAWFVGYTPRQVAGVWVGNDDNSPTKKVTGGNIPAMIWAHYMRNALKGKSTRALPTVARSNDLPWQSGGVGAGMLTGVGDAGYNAGLSQSFWDKLLGGSDSRQEERRIPPENAPFEYEYPSERRRR